MTASDCSIVSTAFDLLAKNTALSLTEYTLITQNQSDIEHYLVQHIGTVSTVLYGAFSRKTIASPVSGNIIDMLVLSRESDIKRTFPSRIFSKISDTLIQQHPDARILDGKNTLILPTKTFHYKIHPAYPISRHTYMLPDEKFNDWVKYDINAYNEIFITENTRHKGKLIEIIRMMKAWNRVSGNLFDAYYLELLTTDILLSYEITSYAETLRYIFKAAVAEVVFQKHDPANMEFQIEGLNDIGDLISAMKLLQKSYALADAAIIFEQEGDTEKALNKWRKLLPQVFPTSLDIAVGMARCAKLKGSDALKMITE